MIIVIGRGHGGTRLISRLLLESGIATGNVNYARDMVPPTHMHEAADIYSRQVDYLGDCEWDFSRANGSEPLGRVPRCGRSLPRADPRRPRAEVLQAAGNDPQLSVDQAALPRRSVHPLGQGPEGCGGAQLRLARDVGRSGDRHGTRWRTASRGNELEISVRHREERPGPERFIRIRDEDFCLDHDKRSRG